MQIQKFYANNLPAAVRDVRRTLGPGAVILSTRDLTTDDAVIVPNGGARARVEVTATRGDFDGVSFALKPAQAGASAAQVVPQKNPFAPRRDRGLRAYSTVAGERGARKMGLGPSSTLGPSALSTSSGAAAFSGYGPQKRIPAKMEAILRELRSLGEDLCKPSSQHRRPADSPAKSGNGNGNGNGSGNGERGNAVLASRTTFSKREKPPVYARRSLPETRKPACVVLPPGSQSSSGGMPLRARRVWENLQAQGVDEALAQRILGRTFPSARRFEPSPWKPSETGLPDEDDEAAFEDFAHAVGDFLVRPQARQTPWPAAGPRKIALVGPTGVGKTTTLAKIASHHALRENKAVALVTLDTYRIAAAEQLKTYARLLDVPVEVVWDAARFSQTLERYSDVDYILIDTPGCSPNDRKAILRLAGVLAQDPEIEVHLVVPSGLRPEEMRRAREGFRPLGCRRVVFSKLDEAVTWGNLINTWILDGLDVSYFTMGQRVPEDLEDASLEWLCRALLTSDLTPVGG